MPKQIDVLDAVEEIKNLFRGSVMTQEELENEEGMAEVIAREKGHRAAKLSLGGRVQVLRVLVSKLFSEKNKEMNVFEFGVRVEKYIDNILAKGNYRIEAIIDRLRQHKDSVCKEDQPESTWKLTPPFMAMER